MFKVGVYFKTYPCLFKAGACFACPIHWPRASVCLVSVPIYDPNVLMWHPLLAFDGNLVDRRLLVGLLVRVKGVLALLRPLADRARSWAMSVR